MITPKLLVYSLMLLVTTTQEWVAEPFRDWSLSQAVQILNDSAWAKNETFTRVVGGVGSGVSGEKEIYNTFYVRLLSAPPIRQAYARVEQLHHGYDEMPAELKQRFDRLIEPGLRLDTEHWIVVTVSFRSNDPAEESKVRQYFESLTSETLKNKAFLSTEVFPQIPIQAYFPPSNEALGAKFVFPKMVGPEFVLNGETAELTFELLEAPGITPEGRQNGGDGRRRRDRGRGRNTGESQALSLRVTFPVSEMKVTGELVY